MIVAMYRSRGRTKKSLQQYFVTNGRFESEKIKNHFIFASTCVTNNVKIQLKNVIDHVRLCFSSCSVKKRNNTNNVRAPVCFL